MAIDVQFIAELIEDEDARRRQENVDQEGLESVGEGAGPLRSSDHWAAKDCREYLLAGIRAMECMVDTPMKGLRIGQQLSRLEGSHI